MHQYSWLPDYQQHVLYSLAHADDLIGRTGRILNTYTQKGTLGLKEVVDNSAIHITVDSVAPLPEAIPRLASDALNQLRSTLEHIVYAEILHRLGRPLTPKEARSIEMPASLTADAFDNWLTQDPRKKLPPLHAGTPLHRRLHALQPFQRKDPEAHPLRILVEHTNWSKHRTPSVAATHIGAVIPDAPSADVSVATGPDRPVQIGDVLATVPASRRVPLSIWPKIVIKRPHTDSWHILMHELRYIEQWVREIAVPILITGTRDVTPLPPHLDISIGYTEFQDAIAASSRTSAAERTMNDIVTGVMREDLVESLALHPDAVDQLEAIKSWASTLTSNEVLQKVVRLQNSGPHELSAVIKSMITDALRAPEEG